MRRSLAVAAISVVVSACIWEDRCVGRAIRVEGRCVLPGDAAVDAAVLDAAEGNDAETTDAGRPRDAAQGDGSPPPSCMAPGDCPDEPNSAKDCVDRECVYTCSDSWQDCNDDVSDGCETDVMTDRMHCSECRSSCEATRACVDGSCVDPIASLAGGEMHTCASTESGGVYCWGANPDGQLGDGTMDTHTTPNRVAGVVNATDVLAGGRFTCAIGSDGSLKCWGGDSTTPGGGSTTPASVGIAGDVSTATGGGFHACAIAGTSARCWGNGLSGELGNGDGSSSTTPVEVSSFAGDPVEVSLGISHSCARASTGSIYCWGANFSGQLGFGSSGGQQNAPVAVLGVPDALTVAAGGAHTCGLRGSGIPLCWGDNASGQLGNDTTDPSDEPVMVSGGITDGTAMCAGESHSCLLRTSGEVLCWGDNAVGQLGDGTLDDRQVPTPVSLSNPARLIACGYRHTCAVTMDERVWCWGENFMGRLGDGSSMTRSTPVEVVGLPPPE